jgi:tRNA-specific 2-thiouridylase
MFSALAHRDLSNRVEKEESSKLAKITARPVPRSAGAACLNKSPVMVSGEMNKRKALALLSGGLDSTLAVRLLLDQGLEVEAVNFVSPFCLCGKDGCGATKVAERFGIPLKVINVGEGYLRVIRNPKHGYGRNMNPCIDCRIFMFRKAKKYARETGASFIFTGEVLDQRPMSQHLAALGIIEEEAGLKNRILRPLSARLLPETYVEKKGLVDRRKLLDVHGRSRKRQLQLAKKFNVAGYACPAGGCLLTYKEFASKVRDLLKHKRKVTMKDIALLKIGRHLRFGDNKIIVGRNESENKALLQKKSPRDYFFEVPNCGSPITVLQGTKTKEAVQKAAALTAYYSDDRHAIVQVLFGKNALSRTIDVSRPSVEEVEKLRIT